MISGKHTIRGLTLKPRLSIVYSHAGNGAIRERNPKGKKDAKRCQQASHEAIISTDHTHERSCVNRPGFPGGSIP